MKLSKSNTETEKTVTARHCENIYKRNDGRYVPLKYVSFSTKNAEIRINRFQRLCRLVSHPISEDELELAVLPNSHLVYQCYEG